MDMKSIEPHQTNERWPGVYETILHQAPDQLALELISGDYRWILCWDHWVEGDDESGWSEFNLPIDGGGKNWQIHTRGFHYDLLCPTVQFRKMDVSPENIRMVQFDEFPQRYLNLSKIEGKQRYKMLACLNWNFLCEVYSGKYFYLCSPNRQLIEESISWAEKNEA